MDKEEFEKNLRGFEKDLSYLITNQCVPKEDREDVAQEVRIKLWKKRFYYDEIGCKFNTWAKKVARNCILDFKKHNNTKKESYLNNSISLDDIDKYDEYYE